MDIKTFIGNLKSQSVAETARDLLVGMFREEYTLKALGGNISARVLQNWYEKGLLPYEKSKGKYHHFNFIELIWLFIVEELRSFGMSLENIRRVKEQLFEEYDLDGFIAPLDKIGALDILRVFNNVEDKDVEAYNDWYDQYKRNIIVKPLEEYIPLKVTKLTDLYVLLVTHILLADRVFITISSKGDVTSYSAIEFNELSTDLGQDTKIILPLSKFFNKYLKDHRNLDFLSETGIINKNEAELLDKIHNGFYKEIKITFADTEIKDIKYKEEVKNTNYELLAKIIARKEYQDITIKTENGKIVYTAVEKKNKHKK